MIGKWENRCLELEVEKRVRVRVRSRVGDENSEKYVLIVSGRDRVGTSNTYG